MHAQCGLDRKLVSAGVCPPLAKLLSHPSTHVQTRAVRLASHFVQIDNMQAQAIVDAGSLGALAQLMHSASEQSRWDASVLIANIAAGTQEQLRAVVDANVLRLALEAL